MDRFAFIIHPIDPKRDVGRKFPFLGKILNETQINFFSTFFPPVYISEISGITSQSTGKEIKGWFIACPYTPARMLSLPEKTVYKKIIQTGRMAEKLGAQMLGLGAFTSVVGDAGITVAQTLDIPTTTGDSYTIAIAVQALKKAGDLMGIPVSSTPVAVVGATGAIGQVCAEIIAGTAPEVTLIGRRQEALEVVVSRIRQAYPGRNLNLITATGLEGLKRTPLVLTVTSSIGYLIPPELLLPGSVVCDVARPRDVSALVARFRPDVLVIDGGMVDVPGNVDFHFDFGFPPGKAFACMAETMALTLEGRFEDYTLGKTIHRNKVEEIAEIAARHGFSLSGFRSFDQPVRAEDIEIIRARAKKSKA